MPDDCQMCRLDGRHHCDAFRHSTILMFGSRPVHETDADSVDISMQAGRARPPTLQALTKKPGEARHDQSSERVRKAIQLSLQAACPRPFDKAEDACHPLSFKAQVPDEHLT